MAGKFRDEVAVITGGGSGIGRALGEALASRGARVVLADLNAEAAERVADQIRKVGGRARAVGLDVTDAEAVRDLARQVSADHGCVGYWFNNAGVNVVAELRDTTLEDWNLLIDVNLRGVIHGIQAVYPLMIEQHYGHIINTASLAGLVPAPMEGAYAATKHAVVGLSTTLRAEARALGVRVSVVCPGVVRTPMIDTGKYVRVRKEDMIRLLIERPFGVDAAAEAILTGVARNRAIITVTRTTPLLWWLYRLIPDAGVRLAAEFVGRARRHREP
ncbi:MAG: SDR family NAD(P)-dependent oxidoreductase [Myxococcales bacterium]|nr:SDR family NAD(P)-dependent oxidoreductase [Myxococcales bacterium]